MASKVKALLEEIHRRSIWQILIAYGFGSWVVLGASGTIMDVLGLPDWVPQIAGLICLMLLPLVLATALVEKAAASDLEATLDAPDSWARRWLTWRRVGVVIPVAFALLATGTTGYMGMRVMGIGPAGSLWAAGALDANDPIVLADFGTHTVDATLVFTVTDAFRVDLSQSVMVKLVEESRVAAGLRLMDRDSDAPFDLETAREGAIRWGVKAVIGGEINSVGSGFVLSIRLVVAETGEDLLAYAETAEDADAIIPAIQRLSRKLRGRIGESLKTVRRTPPLFQVRTASLEALKLFTAGSRANSRAEFERCVTFATNAIALDTLFAAAYRLRGICWENSGGHRREYYADYTRAFELRDRMTDFGRADISGNYFAMSGEYQKAVEALESYAELHPDDPTPWYMMAWRSARLRDFARAEELYRRLFERFAAPPPLLREELFNAQFNQGQFEEAEETLRQWEEAMPETAWALERRVLQASARWDYGAAHELRWQDDQTLAYLDMVRGRLGEAEGHFRDAMANDNERDRVAAQVSRLIGLAELRVHVAGDTAGAMGLLEADLIGPKMDSLDPVERPYLELAALYSRAGHSELARETLAEFDTVMDESFAQRYRAQRRGAQGSVALADGRPDQAIPDLRYAHEGVPYYTSPISYLPELGTAYERAENPDSALVQYERYLDTPYIDRLSHDALWLPIVYERLAALHEGRGEVEKAVEYHGKLIDLWKDCDPELRPRVEAAERAIVRLQGGSLN